MRIFRRSWPTLAIYGNRARSDIKVVTAERLERLMALAADGPWSATGRPAWFAENRDEVRRILLVSIGTEEPDGCRGLVTVVRNDGTGGSFTLDLSTAEFERLPDVSREELITLAHRFLLTFPPIDPEPAE